MSVEPYALDGLCVCVCGFIYIYYKSETNLLQFLRTMLTTLPVGCVCVSDEGDELLEASNLVSSYAYREKV